MSPTYKRWYDHDPLLLEVIELLRNEAYRCYQINRKKRLEEIMKNAE